MADYIAVYGSLRRGMQAESKMQRMEFVGQGFIGASLFALGWYPGIKFDGAGNTVVVDVFKLSENQQMREAILCDLDNYEGYSERSLENSLFIRRVTLVALPKGEEILAYTYEYNHPVNRAPLVKDGDWNRAYNSTKATA
jgi:gamma-glutamylcyclotransferase (GGCT)/AIG2-like uncharacterized protein YtfP